MQVLDSQSVLLKDPQSILGHLSEKSSGQVAQKFSFSKVRKYPVRLRKLLCLREL